MADKSPFVGERSAHVPLPTKQYAGEDYRKMLNLIAGLTAPDILSPALKPRREIIRQQMPIAPILAPQEVIPAPIVPVTTTIPADVGISTGISMTGQNIPNVTIPDVAIPSAPTMPAGMTLEQAKAMGAALAPNVNLQPLTMQDIIGTENLRSTIGLLPENVKDIIDTRTQLRATKAAEDAAAVELARQNSGLAFAQDIAKDIPKEQAAMARTEYATKAQERLSAQGDKARRDIEQAKITADINREKFKVLIASQTAGTDYEGQLKQLIAKTKISYWMGNEKDITANQAALSGIINKISTESALNMMLENNANIAALPPELQAQFGLPPEILAALQKIATPALTGIGQPGATGVKVRVPDGGKK